MVFDKIENAGHYASLGKRIAKGLQLLKSGKLDKLPPGKHAIDGDRLYASVQKYKGLPIAKGRWEAHRRYIDIQYVVKGQEIIGWSPSQGLKVSDKYLRPSDIVFFKGGLEMGTPLQLKQGMFAIFYPAEAHMPMLRSPRYAGVVQKIVLKVLAE